MEEKKKIKDAFDKVRKAINRAKSINDNLLFLAEKSLTYKAVNFGMRGIAIAMKFMGLLIALK